MQGTATHNTTDAGIGFAFKYNEWHLRALKKIVNLYIVKEVRLVSDIPGILIMTHGEAGKGLIKSLQMIVGETGDIYAIPLLLGESIEEYVAKVKEVLDKHTTAIALVDLYGGTPSNCAASLTSKYNLDVISGVNLPMVIEAIQFRAKVKGEELRRRLVEAGQNGIKDIKNELNQK